MTASPGPVTLLLAVGTCVYTLEDEVLTVELEGVPVATRAGEAARQLYEAAREEERRAARDPVV